MKLHLDPRPVLFAMTTVLSTIVIHFPSLRCQQTLPFDICGQSVQCGDKNFEYPFWGLDRPAYCGHPGFQLTCQSDVPELLFESVKYRVLDHDSSTDTITVARNDLWNTICPQYLHNTTYDSTVFNGDNFNQQNVSLFYGCASSPTGTFPLAPDYRFQCTVNETTSDSYFITGAVTTNITNVTGQCTIIVTADQSRADRLATPPATDNVDCTVNGNRSDSYFTTGSVSNDITNLSVQCNSSITVPVERSQADRLATPAATDDDLRSALREGFKLQWIANNDNCDRCVRSGGRCGSNSTSPEVFACYCASGNFSLTCNNIYVVSGGGDSKKSTSLGIVLGIIGVVIAILVIGFGIFVCRRRRKRRGVPGVAVDQIEIFIRNYGTLAPKRYRYPEIKKMTNSFLEKLGQGGYGSVYKGQLPDGRRVAVKLLSEATGNGEDFINEVASISRTSHVNIVTLLGFCFEGKKRALLYEFMPNGSLDKFLHDADFHLDWDTLFQIAKGIARGLEYLHRGCNTRIVHFDIKPHNILLDKEFVPKISDFGLAKLCRTKESVVSVMGARGTAGYMAPEVFFRSFGGASHKSDVYSYGMMVLEMTGACKYNKASRTSTSETYFPDWIYKQIEVGGNLGDNRVTTKEEDELARKMMMVSLWCIQTDPSDRPSITKVVEMLEGSFESLQVPPRRFESSPPRPLQGTPSSFVQSSSGDKSIHRAGNDFST